MLRTADVPFGMYITDMQRNMHIRNAGKNPTPQVSLPLGADSILLNIYLMLKGV